MQYNYFSSKPLGISISFLGDHCRYALTFWYLRYLFTKKLEFKTRNTGKLSPSPSPVLFVGAGDLRSDQEIEEHSCTDNGHMLTATSTSPQPRFGPIDIIINVIICQCLCCKAQQSRKFPQLALELH